jgi:thioredoxin reductase (NADPH)
MEQIKPFNPGFTLGESAQTIEKDDEDKFIVTTKQGTKHKAPVVAIAGGLGVFTPRKPPVENLSNFENKGIYYIVKDPAVFEGQDLVISGGGDSALDWALYFAENYAKSVTLVHRSDKFRAHIDSVQKALDYAEKGKIKVFLNAEVTTLEGKENLSGVNLRMKNKEENISLKCNSWLPLFGLTPKLGPIADWGLEIEKNSIKVNNSTDYSTNIPGVYAIGDVNTYKGKLKLILCGFHEGTIMVQSAFKRIFPDRKNILKYTTVTGISGFEK